MLGLTLNVLVVFTTLDAFLLRKNQKKGTTMELSYHFYFLA